MQTEQVRKRGLPPLLAIRQRGQAPLSDLFYSFAPVLTLIVVNIDAYLERINYNGSREVNAETLRALQIAHLRSVPFENLSIHSG